MPDVGVDDADGPAVLRAPVERALPGVYEQRFKLLLVEWVAGNGFVVLRARHLWASKQ